jgi:hypothetical protein
MAAPEAAGRPGDLTSGYRLVVPDGWFTVDLEPGRRERSVAALVERQFRGVSNAPHLKAQARQELLSRAEVAYAAGGLELFLSLLQVSGIPLAASLVIFLVRPPAGPQQPDADDLARTLSDGTRHLSVIDLPAGRSVRSLRRGAPGADADDADTTSLEVFAPVPRGGGWLLLSFSAPFGPLAPAMIKLFDAICSTLRWDS